MGEQNENPEVKPEPVIKTPRKAAEPKAVEKAPEVDGAVVPSDLAEQLDAALAGGKAAFLVTPTALRVDA